MIISCELELLRKLKPTPTREAFANSNFYNTKKSVSEKHCFLEKAEWQLQKHAFRYCACVQMTISEQERGAIEVRNHHRVLLV